MLSWHSHFPGSPGILPPQVTADLLRAPPLRQKLADQLPQPGIGIDAARVMNRACRAVARRCASNGR